MELYFSGESRDLYYNVVLHNFDKLIFSYHKKNPVVGIQTNPFLIFMYLI